ncbi:MAG: ATP-binding cassette domain-containing protein [Verrucomicrobia bacterium]|nr:ATP-binding cassette domain-containing protein [Verrucomicrobiota bacterium]
MDVVFEQVGLKRGERWLVRGLQAEIPAGRFVAVVGSSGVGKSSLLSAIAGEFELAEGRIGLARDGGGPRSPGEHRRHIAPIFQHLLLSGNLSLLTNVLLGRLGRRSWISTLTGFPAREEQEAYALLADLGLGAFARRQVHQLSGGEQQRVAVARALFQQPDLYLADEPVASLDAYFAGRVLGLLRQEARLRKRTVFCVLHDAALVERFADVALSLDPARPDGWSIRTISRRPGDTQIEGLGL